MVAVNMSNERLEICFIKTNSFSIVVLVSLFTLDFQQVYDAQKFLNDINKVFDIKTLKKLGRYEVLYSALMQFYLMCTPKASRILFKSVVNNLIKKMPSWFKQFSSLMQMVFYMNRGL